MIRSKSSLTVIFFRSLCGSSFFLFQTALLAANSDAPSSQPTTAAAVVSSGSTQSSSATTSGTSSFSLDSVANGEIATLPEVEVVTRLDEDREKIVPSLGATVYTIDQSQMLSTTGGDNISFSKLVLRFPGVSEDSEGSGSFHVRDEHANVQYRIDDVLIPESITSFGSQFDTRFASSVNLITGALPAQYGLRESGVLDIHTKNGTLNPGGDIESYGGSNGTFRQSLEYGGSAGKLNYYFSGSYFHSELGIENPTPSVNAIHDGTDQTRAFLDLSYTIDDTSRLSLLVGEANNRFQIPNSPNQSPALDAVTGNPYVIPGIGSPLNSANLNESQREQNNFEVLAYQKKLDDFSFQLSYFNSYSRVSFTPDALGDLYFNGVSGLLDRSVLTNGAQLDSSYQLNDKHTIRFGGLVQIQNADQTADTTVIPLAANGEQIGAPVTFHDHDTDMAVSGGIYLQDEWKIAKPLTINYGGRFDFYQNDAIHQSQLSPRINAVLQLTRSTTVHGGYARYFTPPPLENIPQGSTNQFAGTTGAATPGLPNDPVQSERADYFDLGITQKITPAYQISLDGYYKTSKNTLDDGQFGAAPILSAFNYKQGQIAGVEISQTFSHKGFSAYANIAFEQGIGTQVNSAQSVLFNAADYNYIASHYVYLDHSQTFTGSFGASYKWNETTPYLEVIAGSGLRADTDSVPNGTTVPAYGVVNLGFTQGFKWAHMPNLSARFEITNLFDRVYELRDGSGIGVFAPQYGARRGFYTGLKYSF